jgi:hypothetical protein
VAARSTASAGRQVDGELGGVAGDADAHPAAVIGQVIVVVGYHLAQVLLFEIMHLGPARLAHGTVIRPFVAEVADQFFLLGVEWDHRLIVGLEGPDLGRPGRSRKTFSPSDSNQIRLFLRLS